MNELNYFLTQPGGKGAYFLEVSAYFSLIQAARNCLVNEHNVVKVSDFGMTRYTSHYFTFHSLNIDTLGNVFIRLLTGCVSVFQLLSASFIVSTLFMFTGTFWIISTRVLAAPSFL